MHELINISEVDYGIVHLLKKKNSLFNCNTQNNSFRIGIKF